MGREASGLKAGSSTSSLSLEYRDQQKSSRDPSQIFAHHPTSVIRVGFRNLAQNADDDGSFVAVQQREVTFTESSAHELPPKSKISLAGLDATLPMAYDNDRFFSGDEGYQDQLKEASDGVRNLGSSNDAWGEPDPEMGFFGLLWRWFVKFLMWMTNDSINRLRYTRGLQESLPFQTGYESFTIGGCVRAFDVDKRDHDSFNLALAFKNRNTSRVLVQNLSRWDWFWHLGTSITWSRLFDFVGQFPIIGFTSFPPTENFPSSKDHALRATFRNFFEGSWFTRFFTGKAEGIVTYDPDTAAQNLAAETTGFEVANRNQYGTFYGREKTNDFRFEHRLPTDESIVRTFMTSPAATMVNNGVEHVLRCLAKHWRNMLFQDNGNFAHQRMEQLNPFEILRFHMPTVLHVLANLRGRNIWDTTTLGPFIKKLQHLNPDKIRRRGNDVEQAADGDIEVFGPCQAAQKIVEFMKANIVRNVCGGVPSRMEPFQDWLNAIHDALSEISSEAEAVKEFVASVDTGINLGYELIKVVDWHVPSESRMSDAIVDFILDKATFYPDLPRETINTALQRLSSKDERTLKELVKKRLRAVEAARLLLGRTCTLLERELRRNALDERIKLLSQGADITSAAKLEKNKWYWANDGDGWRVYVFKGISRDGKRINLVDAEYDIESLHQSDRVSLKSYIPVAEAISRAQKAFMVIELDFGKRFSYNAFMEFGSTASSTSLRTRLRRLVTLAQVHCYELDKARRNVLVEVKSSVHRMRKSSKFAASRLVPECKPQNATVLGGGPTGLLSAIHCLQNVILTGGEVKLYEGRDAFDQEAATFERAQIVRLDSRQIAMLRYHLGTGYEDVYIPAKGETDAHLGNTLPTQGFVEVTIKRLESMILDEVINLVSKNLLLFFSDSKIKYDVQAGTFDKTGRHLKLEDRVFDGEGADPIIVRDFTYASKVSIRELEEGRNYDVVLPRERKVRSFRLVEMDKSYDWYKFSALEPGVRDVSGKFSELPPVYMEGRGRIDPTGIIVEKGGADTELTFDSVADKDFRLDFSASHVIVALGKPQASKTHFYATTDEPYAVCCIEGIKISSGMHNFGEKRWGSGLIDDIRSHSDQNTRIIGDFTKSVALVPIIERMERKMKEDDVWKYHFEHFPKSLNETNVAALHTQILKEMESLVGTSFHRERLQTRFFELGNNYYLGMELPREYDAWKSATVAKVAPALHRNAPDAAKKIRTTLARALPNQLDRLWYEACLEVIAEGDVYNPGGRGKIPQLYMINSPFAQQLGELSEHDAFFLFKRKYRVHEHKGDGTTSIQVAHGKETFHLATKTYVHDLSTNTKRYLEELSGTDIFEPVDTFEVLARKHGSSVVRNSGGYVSVMPHSVSVGRASDLSRAPNGYSESKVALASFPVAHVVSHRTLRINRVKGRSGQEDGYITAFVGDAQASPHFMRYSGLTGACINSMSFNNLVAQALQGTTFEERIQRYAFETNWSNGEVVQRGTGANYGQDGFLRPGFPYRKLVDYLYDRALEHHEIGADTETLLSRDWKIKFAAAIVPKGMETDNLFYEALILQLEKVVREKFEDEVKTLSGNSTLTPALEQAVTAEMAELTKPWKGNTASHARVQLSGEDRRIVGKIGNLIYGVILALQQTIDFSIELRLGNRRISSELFNQPKPVDALVDDFAVEAQNFANALTQSVAFAAATIALQLWSRRGANIASALLGVWNIGVSFGTMTNVSRYKNRNEEARRMFSDQRMSGVLKAVFSLMTRDQRNHYGFDENPYFIELDELVNHFLDNARYYNVEEAKIQSFESVYNNFKQSSKTEPQTIEFMRKFAEEFIPGVFHVNSYLQEDLVNIYRHLDKMLSLSKKAHANGMSGAEELYRMLYSFRPQLDATIERGEIRFGFLRSHSWSEMDRTAFPVTLRYILSPLLCQATIAGKTRKMLNKVESMQRPGVTSQTLSRAVRDLDELYHATKESEIASMIFLSSFIVFCFSLFFSIFRLIEFAGPKDSDGMSEILWVRDVQTGVSWVAIGSLLGSLLAAYHFIRKLRHLFSLNSGLAKMSSDPRIRRIRAVTRTQEFLVFLRLLTVFAAAVALPWSIVVQTFGPVPFDLNSRIPIYIATGSVIAAGAAAIMFFLVEFVIRYNLDPCLGQAVCAPFNARIEQIKRSFKSNDSNEIDTPEMLEREAWEYTAREFLHEYRFDTVFAADRFGTILQHLQSGKQSKEGVNLTSV